jgi:hypothetical protein
VLGESEELRILTGASEYLSVTPGENTAALALECSSDDRCAASSGAGVHDLIDEIHEIIRKTNRDLLAHPKMVANHYQSVGTTRTPARSTLASRRAGRR